MIIQKSQQLQQVRAQYLSCLGLPHVLTRCGCHKSMACIDEWASSSLRQWRLLAAKPTDVRFKRSYPQWHKTRTANGLRRFGPALRSKVTAERMPVGTVIRDAIRLLGVFAASKQPRASADLRDWVGNQRDAARKRKYLGILNDIESMDRGEERTMGLCMQRLGLDGQRTASDFDHDARALGLPFQLTSLRLQSELCSGI